MIGSREIVAQSLGTVATHKYRPRVADLVEIIKGIIHAKLKMLGSDLVCYVNGAHKVGCHDYLAVFVDRLACDVGARECGDLTLAIDIVNEIAPEHLELCVDNPFDYLDKIKHAGSIFMGKYCPESLGDYFAGPNHTLPTSGTARFSSPLSVDDFVKKSQYTYYTREALMRVADDVAFFASKEGLGAHAKSATVRFEENE